MLLLDASTPSSLCREPSRCALAFRLGRLRHGTTSVVDSKTLFLARVCLGLDCHEFSISPSHT